MCFVWAWKTGLWARAIVIIFSRRAVAVVQRTPSSVSRDWTHSIFEVARARLTYSASVLDLEITGCFLAHQETKFGSMKMQAPEVDLLSTRSNPQSASQQASNGKVEVLIGFKWSPEVMVPLSYLRIRLTAVQWDSRGWDINWHSFLTAKHMSVSQSNDALWGTIMHLTFPLINRSTESCKGIYQYNIIEKTSGWCKWSRTLQITIWVQKVKYDC